MERIALVGSGRTDSGVHAVGQVAHFILNKQWDPGVLHRAMNSRLRNEVPDIQVLAVQPVSHEFHAQQSADKKQYSYYFQQGPCALPHLEPFSWWIHRRLDRAAMQRALDKLQGEHDFKPFQAAGSKPGPTVRMIFEAEIHWEALRIPESLDVVGGIPLGFVRIRLVGSGFLKQMVRGIAGTLLEVGEGRRAPESIDEILTTQNRRKVGPTAPARALWLEKVWYSGLQW